MKNAKDGRIYLKALGVYITILPRLQWYRRPDGVLVDTKRPTGQGRRHYNSLGQRVGYIPLIESYQRMGHPFKEKGYCAYFVGGAPGQDRSTLGGAYHYIKEPIEAILGTRCYLRINGSPLIFEEAVKRRSRRLGTSKV